MKSTRWINGLACAVWLLAAALPAQADRALTVFAAASLREALDAVAQIYDAPVAVSYGGSGAVARQVAQGAPADVIILAHPRWMDWLEDRGLIVSGTRFDLLSNRLVLIGPKGAPVLTDPTPERLLARLGDRRLAMGQRDAVPAGLYAAAWLRAIDAWDRLQPHLAETENVRAALALVSRREAPLGLVYASDALADPDVSVVYAVPDAQHPPIVYPVAAVTARADDFLAHLRSPAAVAIFVRHGFTALQADG